MKKENCLKDIYIGCVIDCLSEKIDFDSFELKVDIYKLSNLFRYKICIQDKFGEFYPMEILILTNSDDVNVIVNSHDFFPKKDITLEYVEKTEQEIADEIIIVYKEFSKWVYKNKTGVK